MKPVFTLKVPTTGFTFKPVVPKPKRISDSHKPLTRILYCVAVETEEGWKAHINTKGVEGYQNVTILDFTEKSFELKGVNIVFRKENGKIIQCIRSDMDAMISPGNRVTYCTLCNNCVYSGHIVKVDGIPQFDMSLFKGTRRQCENLITISNKKIKEEE